MVDLFSHLMTHAQYFASGTNLPTGLGHQPTSVSGMVTSATTGITTITNALPPVAGVAGGSVAGYHAVAKAMAHDPQVIQRHHQGIKHGIVGGLVGIGATSIITILAHIL